MPKNIVFVGLEPETSHLLRQFTGKSSGNFSTLCNDKRKVVLHCTRVSSVAGMSGGLENKQQNGTRQSQESVESYITTPTALKNANLIVFCWFPAQDTAAQLQLFEAVLKQFLSRNDQVKFYLISCGAVGVRKNSDENRRAYDAQCDELGKGLKRFEQNMARSWLNDRVKDYLYPVPIDLDDVDGFRTDLCEKLGISLISDEATIVMPKGSGAAETNGQSTNSIVQIAAKSANDEVTKPKSTVKIFGCGFFVGAVVGGGAVAADIHLLDNIMLKTVSDLLHCSTGVGCAAMFAVPIVFGLLFAAAYCYHQRAVSSETPTPGADAY